MTFILLISKINIKNRLAIKADVAELRKKYIENPLERMTTNDIYP